MNEFEFYSDLYHKENDRRTALDGMMNIPIAILTALFSLLLYVGSTYDYSATINMNCFFILDLSMTFVLCIICFTFLSFAFVGRNRLYSGISYTQDLHNWKKSLIEHYQQHGTGSAIQNQELADQEFENHLLDSFVRHVDANMYVNDYKSRNIFLGKRFVVFALVSSLVLIIPYSINYFYKSKEVHYVKIVKK